MSEKSFKIADVKSAELYRVMTEVDQQHHHTDRKIKSKKEWADLAEKISGNDTLKAAVANESDELKTLLGFTATQSKTEAAVVTTKPAEENATKYDEVKAAFDRARGYDEKTGKYAKTLKEAYK